MQLYVKWMEIERQLRRNTHGGELEFTSCLDVAGGSAGKGDEDWGGDREEQR